MTGMALKVGLFALLFVLLSASRSFSPALAAPHDNAMPLAATLTMTFATGEGGHAGSGDINVDVGTITVADGQAQMGIDDNLHVYRRLIDSTPGVRHITLSGIGGLSGRPPSGDGTCGSSSSMWLQGDGNEGVLYVDDNDVNRVVTVTGTVRLEFSDNGGDDHVWAYFSDPTGDYAAHAITGLIFDVPITRGGISTACDSPVISSTWSTIKNIYH